MNSPRSPRPGFSLVEVVLALGILAFSLVAIIGLMDVGLKASRSAQVDTLESGAARSLVSALRTNDLTTFSGTTIWLNYDGTPNASSNGAVYQCVVSTNAPPPGISSTNMIGLQLAIQYPVSAPPAGRLTRTFHASLLRQ